MSDYEDQLQSDDDDFDPDFDDGGKETFRVRNALQPPRASPWSAADLHKAIHEGRIDLNPPYQRDVVWPEVKQIGLIDSIFRNFYIPPVIFAVYKDEDGQEVRTCVDGKQRLTSIVKFIDGQIPHHDVITKKKYWFTRADNLSKSRVEIPEPFKKQFERKQITCVEYLDLKPGTERDIFQRVQLGMSLTPAEKLQAIPSPLSEWISTLETSVINAENGLSECISMTSTRGREFQNIAQLCYFCWSLPKFTLPTVTQLEKWLSLPVKPSDKFKNQVKGVLRSFLYIASNSQYNQGFTQLDNRVAPVEFVFIGVLLAKMRNASYEAMAEQILALRSYTRQLHKDVRSNERVMRSMWEFIEAVKLNDPDPFQGWEAPGLTEPLQTGKRTTVARKRKIVNAETSSSRKKGPAAGKPTRSTRVDEIVNENPNGNGVQFVA